MSAVERRFMYGIVKLDATTDTVCDDCPDELSNLELDFLDSELNSMDLETAELFRIDQVFEYRPDLISMRFYGTYHFGWLIARHNNFTDMVFDFYTGRKIQIPDVSDYVKLYNRFSRTE